MKLVIDIPDDEYAEVKALKYPVLLEKAVQDGIPLDDVKAEIKALPYDTDPYEYAIDDVIEILDNIGKGDKEC